MYEFVKLKYEEGMAPERCKRFGHQCYQVQQMDGYDMTSRNLYCNGCLAAGINFAAGLVSLFYDGGDLKGTIKIGALAGWD